MTDQYYNREDNLDYDAQAGFDTLKAEERALSTVVSDTVEQLNRVAQLTEWLHSRQTDADDAAFIHEIYEIANTMGTRITQTRLAQQSAGAFARKMFENMQRLVRNYNEISDELEAVEDDLETLRGDFEDTMLEAYDQIFTEMQECIRDLTGCGDWNLIYRFSDFLVGNKQPTPEQKRLLCELLQTFQVAQEQVS